ncbi:gfo/Idh/MocA family oxidoreductase [Gracilibacillus salitolerans]|uniref:Gfo/Idh/MocA family oxidoreductase n=1 Tax=Gracilibacillus salitolerans TaxID=2663022 RepID=A0A5Q2TPG8_9BACI|nr:Gfo/Idh/MocA family oxidoreductase [Gracilibacillus salitolerans]QGH36625.1 gfo/Idh/MocA family oxidoreductase [Gracilibacillus salitolerans]
MLKVGIISFAHMHGFSYANALTKSKNASLESIWDNDKQRGTDIANTFKTSFYTDLDEMLQTDLDAVIVCSENANHKEHVVKAAHYKKHILCEKPIATEINDAMEMIEACNQNNVILQIAFPVRFAPAIQEVQKLVNESEIGNILAVNTTNHGQMPGGWFVDPKLSGGGCATDHIVHIVDTLRWILKDEVKSVYAEFDTRFYDIVVEDCGQVILEFASGIVVTIDPSWSRPKTFPIWGDVTLEFFGDQGTCNVDAFKEHTLLFNDRDNKLEHLVWSDDMDERLIKDFLHCVTESRPPFITGEDGLRTLEVVKAAYQSNQQKRPITLIHN